MDKHMARLWDLIVEQARWISNNTRRGSAKTPSRYELERLMAAYGVALHYKELGQ